MAVIEFDCQIARGSFRFDVAFAADGGITALLGPSGSGKTTAIRLLAGLDRPDSGRIVVDGTVLVDGARGHFLRLHRRRIGLVFQDALLLPHLPVKANLLYGRWFTPASQRTIAFGPVVEVLGIGHLLARQPGTLSGGERQRVAIGRAMLTSPQLLLMDEPMAALDIARKRELLPFIERLRDEFRIPIIYVSHAVEEVARLASSVVRLQEGRVAGVGSTSAMLALPGAGKPRDRFEVVSILNATARQHLAEHAVTQLCHPAGSIIVPGKREPGTPTRVMVRGTHVALAVGAPGDISVRTILSGTITQIHSQPDAFALVTLALPGGDSLTASITRLAIEALRLQPGMEVLALVKAATMEDAGDDEGPLGDQPS